MYFLKSFFIPVNVNNNFYYPNIQIIHNKYVRKTNRDDYSRFASHFHLYRQLNAAIKRRLVIHGPRPCSFSREIERNGDSVSYLATCWAMFSPRIILGLVRFGWWQRREINWDMTDISWICHVALSLTGQPPCLFRLKIECNHWFIETLWYLFILFCKYYMIFIDCGIFIFLFLNNSNILIIVRQCEKRK